MKGAQKRLFLVSGTVLLTVFLYFVPSQVNRKENNKEVEAGMKAGADTDSEALLLSAKSALDSVQTKRLVELEKELNEKGSDDTLILDKLGRFWDANGIPAASATWFERKSVIVQSEQSYLDAAYRYFDAFRLAGDSSLKGLMVNKAIAFYSKVLELNPDNLNAKTDLGACYADGTAEPMKGIMMLREVVEKDPNHEMAQYNLGMLSVKSGQLDKAIDRFNKVLTINPDRNEVHYFLGQVWLQKGDTTKAIGEYESFVKSAKYDVSDVIQMLNALKTGQAKNI